jgi:nucleoside phosphorylase
LQRKRGTSVCGVCGGSHRSRQPVDDIVNSSDFEDEDVDVDSDGEVMVLDI